MPVVLDQTLWTYQPAVTVCHESPQYRVGTRYGELKDYLRYINIVLTVCS